MKNKKRILYIIGVFAVTGYLVSCNEVDNTYTDYSTLVVENKVDKMNNEENLKDKEVKEIKDIVEKEKNDIAILVNKNNSLEPGYKPADLVVPDVRLYCPRDTERSHMREVAARALEEMFKAAENNGMELYLVSAFRSSAYQEGLFNNSLIRKGKEHTEKYIAKPNHSEHQTGLVADISTKGMNFELEPPFKETLEGHWLAENAYKYGFILRYQEGRESETGYSFEPWHFRYVGKKLSEYIHKNDLILEDLYN